ncbi:hypothetical protein GOQ30_06375 [Flavobacterium sp. TP390]|uniref:Uncharacterized protein n=1 Tax=Flavobacterium profundi TaxID=1774945 RepID=A0A6I4ISC7_9FLAO|nr:hypothetical protein [Flavobacterium profundi]MVO08787.1 hypothetical protein [Flavobacterium profundi]
MKKDSIFKSNLFLSQHEIAMLLNINRSQWAMFLSGKRDIPPKAKLKLANLIAISNNLSNEIPKNSPYLKNIEEKKNKILLEEFRKNLVEKEYLEKKLDQLKRNYFKANTTFNLISKLKEGKNLKEIDILLLSSIENKIINHLEKNGLHIQKKLQLKINTLIIYKNQLEREIKNNELNL